MSSLQTGSAGLLIITQVASRALTFIGNQFVLRYSSPTLLGIAVQLELVSITVLYFARESLRVALQRQPSTTAEGQDVRSRSKAIRDSLQGAINTAYLAVGLGLMIGLASFTYYLSIVPYEVTSSPNFGTTFQLYVLATVFELLSEPAFVVIQQQALFRARAAAETRAAIARCLVACSVAFYTHRSKQPASTLPFASGQLAYGLTLLTLYTTSARRVTTATDTSLLPTRLSTPAASLLNLIPPSLLTLSLTFYAQSTLKLLLTQSDALLLSLLSPLHSQGAFALASNYGGLLARLLFQPIEESSRNTFGRLLSKSSTPSASTPSPANNITSNTTNVRAALTHLATTLHIYLLGAIPVLVLAPTLLPILTPLILAPQWRTPETTALLGSYVYYIPLTAINGVLDAFVTSVATPKQLRTQSLSMLAVTALYGAAAWLFLNKMEIGASGLVWASGVAMGARIAYGGWFVRGWIAEAQRRQSGGEFRATKQLWTEKKEAGDDDISNAWFWKTALPDTFAFVAAGAVWVGLRLALPGGEVKRWDVKQLGFVGLSAVVLGLCLVVVEGEFLRGWVREVVPRRVVERVPLLGELLGIEGEAEGEKQRKKEL